MYKVMSCVILSHSYSSSSSDDDDDDDDDGGDVVNGKLWQISCKLLLYKIMETRFQFGTAFLKYIGIL